MFYPTSTNINKLNKSSLAAATATTEKVPFPLQCIFLKINGSWPIQTDRKPIQIGYAILAWYVIFSVGITIYFQSAYLWNIFGDIMKTTENCCTTFMGALNFIRLLHMRLNQDKMKQLIQQFVTNIWIPKGTDRQIEKSCQYNMIIFRLQSIMSIALITMYCTVPLIELFLNPQIPDKPFPYKMIFFYDTQNHIVRYIFTYLFTALAGFAVVTTLFAEDSLFGFMVTYTCGQFRLLQNDIGQIIPTGYANAIQKYGKKNCTNQNIQDEYNLRLHDIIQKHTILINFCNTLNSFFSPLLLVNFAISSILICMVGFQIVTGKMFIGDFLKFIVYIISSLSQLFVLCWNGDNLIQDSTETALSLYFCNWEGGKYHQKNHENNELITDLTKKTKDFHPAGILFTKKLRFMIMRAQKPVKITAMKYSDLSLQSFTTIISSSMSYFTLLQSLVE